MDNGSSCTAEASLGELYERNLWVRQFIQAVCDLYGVPSSIVECISKADRELYAWGLLHCAQAFTLYPEWIELRKSSDKVDPVSSADRFIRTFYEKEGRDVIPTK